MDYRHERDEWLMGQLALGRRECLEPLVRRYSSPLLTFIRRMVADRHHSEELFQEVFLAVWRKRKRYEFPRPFKAWLYAIAVNQCRASFRKRRPALAILEEDAGSMPAADQPTPSEVVMATEKAALVAEAVSRLSVKQRTVVVLRVWDGLEYWEIAEILGRSEATVRSHMHHGLAAMRRFLEPRLGST